MIEIPIGKALVTVEKNKEDCAGQKCAVYRKSGDCMEVSCSAKQRRDGKNVMFKLVDYPHGEQ